MQPGSTARSMHTARHLQKNRCIRLVAEIQPEWCACTCTCDPEHGSAEWRAHLPHQRCHCQVPGRLKHLRREPRPQLQQQLPRKLRTQHLEHRCAIGRAHLRDGGCCCLLGSHNRDCLHCPWQADCTHHGCHALRADCTQQLSTFCLACRYVAIQNITELNSAKECELQPRFHKIGCRCSGQTAMLSAARQCIAWQYTH